MNIDSNTLVEFYSDDGLSTDMWEPEANLLEAPVPPGGRAVLQLPSAACEINLLGVFANGSEVTLMGFDACRHGEVLFPDGR